MNNHIQRCITSVGPTVAALMGAPYEYHTNRSFPSPPKNAAVPSTAP